MGRPFKDGVEPSTVGLEQTIQAWVSSLASRLGENLSSITFKPTKPNRQERQMLANEARIGLER